MCMEEKLQIKNELNQHCVTSSLILILIYVAHDLIYICEDILKDVAL